MKCPNIFHHRIPSPCPCLMPGLHTWTQMHQAQPPTLMKGGSLCKGASLPSRRSEEEGEVVWLPSSLLCRVQAEGGWGALALPYKECRSLCRKPSWLPYSIRGEGGNPFGSLLYPENTMRGGVRPSQEENAKGGGHLDSPPPLNSLIKRECGSLCKEPQLPPSRMQAKRQGRKQLA